MNVLVTGGAGYLASLLLPRLVADPEVAEVVALDVREPPPAAATAGVRFVRASVLDRSLDTLLRRHRISLVAHLAWVFNPSHDRERMRTVDVAGSRNVVEAAAAAGVAHLLYLSSTTAYGAFPDNPERLTEDHPTRAGRFPYAADKAAVEALLDELEARHRRPAITRARPCIVLGRRTDNFVKAMLELPVLVRWRGHDPGFQFLAESDLAEALHLLCRRRPAGAFNIAPDDAVTLSELGHLSGRRTVALPGPLLTGLVAAGWALRLFPAPPSYLDFIRWPWLADASRARVELGFRAATSSRQAVAAALGRPPSPVP